jgi:CAAX protease family protein
VKPLAASPVPVILAFVGALLAATLVAAVASPWVQAALAPIAVFPLHRVFVRLTMLAVLGIAIWLLKRHGLTDRATLGFVGPWSRFARRAALGLLAGIVLMKIALLPLFLLQVRAWNAATPLVWTGWLPLIARGLGTGLVVALIEETFFRGAMQGALQRIGATRWALFAVPLLYAAVHFLGRPVGMPFQGVPYGEVTGWSGFAVLREFFATFAHPLAILDACAALWCVGVLLALVRRRWGDLGGCIGLHAGFVATIVVFRKVSSPAPDNHWSFLVGNFDGLLGWWIALLAGLACLGFWRPAFRNLNR